MRAGGAGWVAQSYGLSGGSKASADALVVVLLFLEPLHRPYYDSSPEFGGVPRDKDVLWGRRWLLGALDCCATFSRSRSAGEDDRGEWVAYCVVFVDQPKPLDAGQERLTWQQDSRLVP